MKYKIITDASHPVLHSIAEHVLPYEMEELAITLDKVLKRAATGIGLALPQIGISKAGFMLSGIIFNPSRHRFCFNPCITKQSDKKTAMIEGCLSLPGINVNVERPEWVEVRYTNQHGQVIDETLYGMPAKAFQHELDHLDGVLITDKPVIEVIEKPVKSSLLPLALASALVYHNHS